MFQKMHISMRFAINAPDFSASRKSVQRSKSLEFRRIAPRRFDLQSCSLEELENDFIQFDFCRSEFCLQTVGQSLRHHMRCACVCHLWN